MNTSANDHSKAPEPHAHLNGQKPRWRDRVFAILRQADAPLALSTIYDHIEARYPDLTRARQFWRDRVRATLEGSADFVRVEQGIWDLAERHSQERIVALERARRDRYPLRPKSAS